MSNRIKHVRLHFISAYLTSEYLWLDDALPANADSIAKRIKTFCKLNFKLALEALPPFECQHKLWREIRRYRILLQTIHWRFSATLANWPTTNSNRMPRSSLWFLKSESNWCETPRKRDKTIYKEHTTHGNGWFLNGKNGSSSFQNQYWKILLKYFVNQNTKWETFEQHSSTIPNFHIQFFQQFSGHCAHFGPILQYVIVGCVCGRNGESVNAILIFMNECEAPWWCLKLPNHIFSF